MDNLFKALRGACSNPTWSRAVELVRADAIVLESKAEDEVELRVSPSRGLIHFQVFLYPEDEDWSCDCPSKDDACEHAAAAVISLRRGAQGDTTGAPTTDAVARLRYRFTRHQKSLCFQRCLVLPTGEEIPLEGTLTGATAKGSPYPRFTTTGEDLKIEAVLGPQKQGVLHRHVLSRLLPLLKGSERVHLEGAPVTTASPSCGLRARVEDHPEGFWLRLQEDKSIDEIFSNGALRRGAELMPLANVGLTAKNLHRYREGVVLRFNEVAELTNTILPELEGVMPVDVHTTRLPGRTRVPPRLQVHTTAEADTLFLLPTIVYGTPPIARVDGDRLVHLQGDVPLRNRPREQRLARRLREELGMTPGIKARFSRSEGVKVADRLQRWSADEVVGDAHIAFRRAPTLIPRFDPQAPLSVDFVSGSFPETSAGSSPSPRGSASPQAVLDAWQNQEPLVPLLEGGWAPLPTQWLEQNGRVLADLLAAKSDTDSLPRASLRDLATLHEALNAPPPPEFQRLVENLNSFEPGSAAPLPDALTATLRDYQTYGVNWLHGLRKIEAGALLADDMGLGKTLQALCLITEQTLVICPTSVLPNWLAETRKFRPDLQVSVYHGPKRKLDPSAHLTLTTYALLRNDREILSAHPFKLVILDESQAIKNPDSKIAQAAYALRSTHRIAMTGTPVENRLEELWSQFHFINPGFLGGRADFQRRYARPIRDGDETLAGHLRKRIRPFVLRRLKNEVAKELPPRTDIELYCELSEPERAVYDAIRLATKKDLLEKLNAGGSVLAALEALLRLRQASCHSALVPGAERHPSSKVKLLVDTLEPLLGTGHKALVFSQWTSFLNLIEPELAGLGVDFLRLDGSTGDRGAVVQKFQDPNGPPLLLISLKAGGTGLNLTAADHVFLMDPWWNPAVEDQAADRTHRIGQDRPVFVHRVIARETVEEKILALQAHKRELANLTLAGSNQRGGISREELLELLL